MSKNWVEPEGPHMTSQHGAYALHAGLARLHARTRFRPIPPYARLSRLTPSRILHGDFCAQNFTAAAVPVTRNA